MKTVGLILKGARLAKKLSLEQIESATKIRLKFLQAIEADDFSQLPSLIYAKGFVKNYSEYLGLKSSDVLAFLRRQTQEITKTSILPKGIAKPLNRSALQLTPGKFIFLVVLGLVALFLFYLGGQYINLSSAPSLFIEEPKDKTSTTEKRIDVQGRTDPDATVVVNGVNILVRGDGRFFDQTNLEPGLNKIMIAATSRFGKITTKTIVVDLKQP